MNIVITAGARQDIIDITNYTIEKWGYRQADKVNDEIESAYQMLLTDPYTLLSRSRDELKANLSNASKINLHSVFTIFRYTSLKSLAVAPLCLRFSPRLSKNGFDIIEDLFSPH